MTNNSEENEIHFEGEIKGRPTMVGDIKEMMGQLGKAYAYLRNCDPEVREIFEPITDGFCDFTCNLCYELGFESPDDIDCNPYYIYRIDNLNE